MQGSGEQFAQIIGAAYHNCAVEYEYLREWPECLVYYQKAVKVCQIGLGLYHEATVTFQKNFDAAKVKVTQQRARPDSVMSKFSGVSQNTVRLPQLKRGASSQMKTLDTKSDRSLDRSYCDVSVKSNKAATSRSSHSVSQLPQKRTIQPNQSVK